MLSLFELYISLWSYLFVSNLKDFEKKKFKMWREKRNIKFLQNWVHRAFIGRYVYLLQDLNYLYQVVLNMTEANLDGNGYWYSLKNHEDDNDPLVPPTPDQSPHSSFRFKGSRGPGETTEQGLSFCYRKDF